MSSLADNLHAYTLTRKVDYTNVTSDRFRSALNFVFTPVRLSVSVDVTSALGYRLQIDRPRS
ncbi:hypothetical protein BTUL_0014g00910 [Botrytis tulipae]|uniref:Uncharacterized protein n=1 Tax=Botrytis tulipae TaxID=87230 RepID=A0A4Z1F0D9_9HELO|nr:hypothetical protein BTUL_0014g00910 [Botrytis tulipae]